MREESKLNPGIIYRILPQMPILMHCDYLHVVLTHVEAVRSLKSEK
jgi:hypothetical protein